MSLKTIVKRFGKSGSGNESQGTPSRDTALGSYFQAVTKTSRGGQRRGAGKHAPCSPQSRVPVCEGKPGQKRRIRLAREDRRGNKTKGRRRRQHGPGHVFGGFQSPKSKTNWRGHAQRGHVTPGAPVPAEAENPSCEELIPTADISDPVLAPSLAPYPWQQTARGARPAPRLP